ncbi:MAG: (d)CMP kinase [Candidatus Omnitrophica bacterium]|nr:(d)CMP kinase [Candidatus Omnitrophota bacterium]
MPSDKTLNAVAIDGPAGSGKSTVSRLVAERLHYLYVDTGAMYRALTLKAMSQKIDLADEKALSSLAERTKIALVPSSDASETIKVLLDGLDVSGAIRTLEVTGNVKYIARVPAIRAIMVDLQRKMVNGLGGSVMEGRDIGTVVLPDARYKIYLDASFSERVKRRYDELIAKGKNGTVHEVEKDLRERDHTDMTRAVGPLKKADDAYILDTTGLSIDQVVDRIVNYVSSKK